MAGISADQRVSFTQPCLCQLIASSRRSSPQKSSRPTTNVGEPKMPSSRAISVAAIRAASVSELFANASTDWILADVTQTFRQIGFASSLLAKLEPTTIGCVDKFLTPALTHAKYCNAI